MPWSSARGSHVETPMCHIQMYASSIIFRFRTLAKLEVTIKVMPRATGLPRHILPNSAAQFVKFHEILWRCYPQIPYFPRPFGIVVVSK